MGFVSVPASYVVLFNQGVFFAFLVFVLIFVCVVVHECVHVFLLRRLLGRGVDVFVRREGSGFPFGRTLIEVGVEEDYVGLSDGEYVVVLLGGVVVGLVPLVFVYVLGFELLCAVGLALYVSFSLDDLWNVVDVCWPVRK